MHPSIASIMQYFAFEHLPPQLQAVSKPFAMLASELAKMESSPELTVALRKLLESKDATVRASLPQKSIGDIISMVDGWRKAAACQSCGQTDIGQAGEHPCEACGLPRTWDDAPSSPSASPA